MLPITRRKFLALLGLGGAAAAFPRILRATPAELRKISIIHTTDLHGNILPTATYDGVPDVGGFARCASLIRKWRAANPDCLLLDAGDVFQGTDVGWRTRGKIMMRCFNALNYDAWAIGNHEFDWGMDDFMGCLSESAAAPLSANALLEGKPAGEGSYGSAFDRIQPVILKEVAGCKVGVIGLTTPGLPNWFLPQFTRGFEAADPAAAAARHAARLRELGANAIVILAHMGQTNQDDHANRLNAVAAAVPDATLILGGHTHRDVPTATIGSVPYSQSMYFGIRLGRADLYFDPETKRVVRVETATFPMDSSVEQDPAILSLCASDLEDSEKALAEPAGTLNAPFSPRSEFGRPSDIENLIAAAIFEALRERGVQADAVWHGTFSRQDWPAGKKTVRDVWSVIPFENFVVTGELTAAEILAFLQNAYAGARNPTRSLIGLRPVFERRDGQREPVLTKILDLQGRPLNPSRRYRVAMNTFDAASAGGRMPVLAEIMRAPSTNATIHMVQTREALISYLSKRFAAGVSPSQVARELSVG